MRRVLVFLAAGAAAGCGATASMSVRSPVYPGPKAPYSVALAKAGGPDGVVIDYTGPPCPGHIRSADRGTIDAGIAALVTAAFDKTIEPGVAGADFQAAARVTGTPLDIDKADLIRLSLLITHNATGERVFWDEETVVYPFTERGDALCALPGTTASKRAAALGRSFAQDLQQLATKLAAAMPDIIAFPETVAKLRAAEREGDAAAASGRSQEAFDKYRAALQLLVYGTPRYQELLDSKFLPLAAKVEVPAMTEDARRLMIMGKTKLQTAKDVHGGLDAVRLLQQAVAQAPWRPELYFDVALAEDAAQLYKAAAKDLRRYLVAKPDAADAAEIRKRAYALEAR